MFTDYTCFSHDLLTVCVDNGMASLLNDCMSQGDVDYDINYLANELEQFFNTRADHSRPTPELLAKVCRDSGGWTAEELAGRDNLSLFRRAIFCSLPERRDLYVAVLQAMLNAINDNTFIMKNDLDRLIQCSSDVI